MRVHGGEDEWFLVTHLLIVHAYWWFRLHTLHFFCLSDDQRASTVVVIVKLVLRFRVVSCV